LSVPLKVGGEFIGGLGIISMVSEREWSGEVVQRFKLVGELFANALTRKRAEEALQHLSGRLISAQEEDRRRLARELHDDVSQRLAVLAIEAGKLEQQSHYTPDFIHGKLQGMKDHIVKLAGDIHRISRQLHPSILDDLGLVDAMESECRRFSDLEGIPVKFTADRFPEETPKDVSLCLYRVTQESLRNIAKHSQATDARVTLTRKNGSIFLSVEDAGVGFEPAKARVMPGLGLASMAERVRLINGSLSIHSAPGKGTVIEIQAPLACTDRV
jgi:signal transduction histidine kinase